MKVERNKLRKGTSDVPIECEALMKQIMSCADSNNLIKILKSVSNWTFGKSELYHWVDVLDRFDYILELAAKPPEGKTQWQYLSMSLREGSKLQELVVEVLRFTALLIEHSYARHLYNSMEHLTTLLASPSLNVILATLNLLYVFSKRSNFISRMQSEKRKFLLTRLQHLAESWGGNINGFGLSKCARDLSVTDFPASATTLHFEYHMNSPADAIGKEDVQSANVLYTIHLENLDKYSENPCEIMSQLMSVYNIPETLQMQLFTRVLLASTFSNYEKRLRCIEARLQATSILVYCNISQDILNSILYPGLIEELVEVLETDYSPSNKLSEIMEIKAAVLRTLTSIIHLERNPRINNIIEATGASSYHGFLPSLVHAVVEKMTSSKESHTRRSTPMTTALFSFLYHLASYEAGGEALVSSGLVDCLLRVVRHPATSHEYISFVTRAVRVIDLITNLDMTAFQSHDGLNCFIERLEHEVTVCRQVVPFVISATAEGDNSTTEGVRSEMNQRQSDPSPMSIDSVEQGFLSRDDDMTISGNRNEDMDVENVTDEIGNRCSDEVMDIEIVEGSVETEQKINNGKQCLPLRAALLKSILNFLKKAIPEQTFSDSIRGLMETTLPNSLKHIISNASFYGASLFLSATDVVAVYIFQEPTILSVLQDNGLSTIIIKALIEKEVPATREVLSSLPNVLGALCLNARGLEQLVKINPFPRLFRVLISEEYLPAMRRRRSSDQPGDTAFNLGVAMDEFMRHQPSIRGDAMKAIIGLIKELVSLGTDEQYLCLASPSKNDPDATQEGRSTRNADVSSDEEDETENTAASLTLFSREIGDKDEIQKRKSIPLLDYIFNVAKFLESIIGNHRIDDHCHDFIRQGGLTSVMELFALPNLPLEYPTTTPCQAVSQVVKDMMNLSRDGSVLRSAFTAFREILLNIQACSNITSVDGSMLLKELSCCNNLETAADSFKATPVLHYLCSASSYVNMLTQVCRTGQLSVQTVSIKEWGSDDGITLIESLSDVYLTLIFETGVLHALGKTGSLPEKPKFCQKYWQSLLITFKDAFDAYQGSVAAAAKSALSDNSACVQDKRTSRERDQCNLTHVDGKGVRDVIHFSNVQAKERISEEIKDVSLSPSCFIKRRNKISEGLLNALSEVLSKKDRTEFVAMVEALKSVKDDCDDTAWQSRISHTADILRPLIKPLFATASSLGHAIADLFTLLVKACVGPSAKHRNRNNYPVPTEYASSIINQLCLFLYKALTWNPPMDFPYDRLRLVFLVCAIGITSNLLFDERKFPYYIVLKKFMETKCDEALFGAFAWVVDCDKRYASMPKDDAVARDILEMVEEFFESWLGLLVRFVNTNTMLDAQYPLAELPNAAANVDSFNPLQLVIRAQKVAFTNLQYLWNKDKFKHHSPGIVSSILTISCMIINGDSVIRQKLKSLTDGVNNSQQASTSVMESRSNSYLQRVRHVDEDERQINESYLTQLLDMGFSSTQARTALRCCETIEQATEYIINHLSEIETTEEDQLRRAIEASISELATSPDSVTVSESANMTTTVTASTNDCEGVDEQVDVQPVTNKEDHDPIPTDQLDEFTRDVLHGCLMLLELSSDSVYRICDVIVTVAKRNGIEWQKEAVLDLVGRTISEANAVVNLTTFDDCQENTLISQNLTSKILLLSLLMEELRIPCASIIAKTQLTDLLIRLLDTTQKLLFRDSKFDHPQWLGPLLILIDLQEKIAIASKRRAKRNKNCTYQWQWHEARSGRWSNYSDATNKEINAAYVAGNANLRFAIGRRRYNVDFTSMVQVNEDTGTRRPVMLMAQPTNDKQADSACDSKSKDDHKDGATDEANENFAGEVIDGFNEDQALRITRSCAKLLKVVFDPDTVHAILRICLRLTRDYRLACAFVENDGIEHLLQLKDVSVFMGFRPLATLLLRHIFEEWSLLNQAMINVIQEIINVKGGRDYRYLNQKEFNYVLRRLGPAICRNEDVFVENAKKMIRFAIPSSKRTGRDSDLDKHTVDSFPQHVKLAGDFRNDTFLSILPTTAQRVLKVLLDTLYVETVSEQVGKSAAINSTNDSIHTEKKHHDNDSDTKQTKSEEMDKSKTSKLLFKKSAILQLLSELVHCYPVCCHFIAEYIPESNQNSKGIPVLAHILDNLLPAESDKDDQEISSAACSFLVSISLAFDFPETQALLVSEIKASMSRALSQPVCQNKHLALQAIANLISSIIDTSAAGDKSSELRHKFGGNHNYDPKANYIVLLLNRKGLVTDLARIPHSLDLSSQYMPMIVNAALKPLESFVRILNTASDSSDSSVNRANASSPQASGQEDAVFVTDNNHQDGSAGMRMEIVDDGNMTDNASSNSFRQSRDTSSETHVETVNTGIEHGQLEEFTASPSFEDDDDDEDDDDEDDEDEDDEDDGDDDQACDDEGGPYDNMASDGESQSEESDRSCPERIGSTSYAESSQSEVDSTSEASGGMDNSNSVRNREIGGIDIEDMQTSNRGDENIEDNLYDCVEEFSDQENDAEIEMGGNNDDIEEEEEEDEEDGDRDDDNDEDGDNLLDAEGDDDLNDALNDDRIYGFEEEIDALQFLNESDHMNPRMALVGDLFGRGNITSRRQPSVRTATFHSNISDVDPATVDPNRIPTSHPLLMRSSDRLPREGNLTVRNVWSRPDRITRHNRLGHTSLYGETHHVGFSGQSTSSYSVLQRLLDHAQAAANEALNLRAAFLHDGSHFRHTEFIFDSDGFHVLSPEGTMDDFQGSNQFASTLHRWKEECGILDSGSVFDCILNAKERLTPVLIKYRNENIVEAAKSAKLEKSDLNDRLQENDKKEQETCSSNTEDMDVTLEAAGAQSLQSETMDTTENNDQEPVIETSTEAIADNDSLAIGEQNAGLDTSSREREASEISNTEGEAAVLSSELLRVLGDAVHAEIFISGEGRRLLGRPEDPSTAVATNVPVMGAIASSTQDTTETAGPSGESQSASNSVIEGLAVPEGIDPTFLSAIPENMREEVIRDHIQRTRRLEQATPSGEAVSSFNPEFLAALPPEIQEEVLLQEGRLRAGRTGTSEQSFDPSAFVRDLNPSLRRTILADMDDSHVNLLPQDLQTEARQLRQQMELRQARLLHGRLNYAEEGRESRHRDRVPVFPMIIHEGTNSERTVRGIVDSKKRKSQNIADGQKVLDHESLTCLLTLLFCDEPKLNLNRLHRLVKALCQNGHTAAWVVHTLLSILNRTAVAQDNVEVTSTQSKTKKLALPKGATNSGQAELLTHLQSHNLKNKAKNLWLSMSVDAALGCKANVFTIQKTSQESNQVRSIKARVSIHPLAAPMVCRRVIDLLVFLARHYNQHFIPYHASEAAEIKEAVMLSDLPQETDFWDYLVKLEQTSLLHRGKIVPKVAETDVNSLQQSLLQASPLGQVLCMLRHPVIRQSTNLTDRILKLLFVISGNMPNDFALPELSSKDDNKDEKSENSEVKKSRESPQGESSNVAVAENTSSRATLEAQLSTVLLDRLQLVIDVMCTGRCTEDGLEDATNFLIHLSRSLSFTRHGMLNLLLEGSQSLGKQLRKDICCLLQEMRENTKYKLKKRKVEETEDSSDKSGNIAERFSQSAPLGNIRTGYDSRLTSGRSRRLIEQHFKAMAPLTCKTSSQALFLRMLKVTLQLRSQPGNSRNNERVQNVAASSSATNQGSIAIASAGQSASFEFPQASYYTESLRLSQQIDLNELWDVLGECLSELGEDSDSHAVLILQPAVEAFFLVHSADKDKIADKESATLDSPISQKQLLSQLTKFAPISPTPSSATESYSTMHPDTAKFVQFAEKHRTVLNQILRQSPTPLLEGPFSILVNHTRLLDFDVKRKYFTQQLDKLNDNVRPEDGFTIRIRRTHVFEDSFKELSRRTPDQMKSKMFVHFEGEDGQDAGGLLREWYLIISREIFNPNYALFNTSSGDRVTYIMNSSSHVNHYHLEYFKFVGRVIAKALYDSKLLDVYFSRSMYKHILGIPVHYSDIEAEDYTFYQSMKYLLEHNIDDIDNELTFSTEVCEFGKSEVRDLKPDGRSISVTEANKLEYVHLMCQMKMTGAIRKQIASFLEGFYEIIPKRLISIFDPQELELFISGLPTIDVDDLKANTDYSKYTKDSIQIQWFWRALRNYDQASRAKFLQFVTGTSRVPLQGFTALEGMNGPQKFSIHRDDMSTDRLPSAHTCFNQLDLPAYETYDKLHKMLSTAINECPEGFGLV